MEVDMQTRRWLFVIILCLFATVGCSTAQSPTYSSIALHVQNHVPAKELAYYNDSFDQIQNDLYNRPSGTTNSKRTRRVELADMSIEQGRLVITTKPTTFSTGGLTSRYKISGDFDIQVDCQINFIEGVRNLTQRLYLHVSQTRFGLAVGLIKIGNGQGHIISTSGWGTWKHKRGPKMSSFNGSLRIVRIGNQFISLYRDVGENQWHELQRIDAATGDCTWTIGVKNFIPITQRIDADEVITGAFDNFRINAAGGIVESDI